jgi:hypothetical protein
VRKARLARGVALTLLVAALAETLRLLVIGGFEVTVAGHLLRSNDPRRPFVLALVAAGVYTLAGGTATAGRLWQQVRHHAPPARLAVFLALAFFATTAVHSSTAAGGADASGYVSEADLWLHGPLRAPQAWAGRLPWPNAAWSVSPLGYKPVEFDPPYEQVPTYSPGLPLLLAAAKWVGGQGMLFLVVPISGAVLVLATFGIGRRLHGPWTGLAAAGFAATTPIALGMALVPMSDVPAGAAWAVSFYYLLGGGLAPALASGLAAAVAIAIRPNLAFFVPILAVWFLVRPLPEGPFLRARLAPLVAFGLGALPGVILVGAVFDYLYGSPLTSGYGRYQDSHHLRPTELRQNVVNYVTWALGSQPFVTVAGLTGLLTGWLWPSAAARRASMVMLALVLSISAEYTTYLVFPDWYFLRFFLPVLAFVAVGAAMLCASVAARLRGLGTGLAVVFVLAGCLLGLRTVQDRQVFGAWHGERRYIAAAQLLHDRAVPNSVVFSMQHSGSLRYYSGVMPLRYDQFSQPWLDQAVDWLAKSGVHSYAVLDEGELPEFEKRLVDQSRLARPLVEYDGYHDDARVFIYDLTTPPTGLFRHVVVEPHPERWRSAPGGPAPTLVIQPAPRS